MNLATTEQRIYDYFDGYKAERIKTKDEMNLAFSSTPMYVCVCACESLHCKVPSKTYFLPLTEMKE